MSGIKVVFGHVSISSTHTCKLQDADNRNRTAGVNPGQAFGSVEALKDVFDVLVSTYLVARTIGIGQ